MTYRTSSLVLIASLGLNVAAAQSRPMFFDRAQIERGDTGITMTCYDPLPLFQAVFTLRLLYGWQVNLESAPGYSRFDVVDDTGPRWRAAHPTEKGVTRPAGGLFTATLPIPRSDSSDAERAALARLVAEYNTTSNPGKYVLRMDPDGVFTIVGTAVRNEAGTLEEISPLLDTPVTFLNAQRSVYDTIMLILDALQSATGKKTLLASVSNSLFVNTKTKLGGESRPARELINEALMATGRRLQYSLVFNPDVPVYVLSISPVMKESADNSSEKKFVPLDHLN